MGDRNKQHTDYDEQAWDGELNQANNKFLQGVSFVNDVVAGVAYPFEIGDLATEHNDPNYKELESAVHGTSLNDSLDHIASAQVGSNPWVYSKTTNDSPATPRRSRRRKRDIPKAPRKGKRNPKRFSMGYLKRKNNRDLLHRKSNMYIVNRF